MKTLALLLTVVIVGCEAQVKYEVKKNVLGSPLVESPQPAKMPSDRVDETPQKLSELKVGETADISPAVIDLDKEGLAWIWVGAEVGNTYKTGKATREKDGWSVVLPKSWSQKWRVGEKGRHGPGVKYEPVLKINWE